MHCVGEAEKAGISKQESFSTTLSRSYIVFTLGKPQLLENLCSDAINQYTTYDAYGSNKSRLSFKVFIDYIGSFSWLLLNSKSRFVSIVHHTGP